MARRKAFDPEEALERAKALFWRKGYEATSIQDLVEALGINRGSLYATFPDKRSLFLMALERYAERDLAATTRVLRLSEAPGRERIQALFDTIIRGVEERGDRRGCFVCNAAVELAPFDAEIERRVRAAIERIQAAFAVALAADPAVPSEPERRDRRAAFLTTTLMGVYVMAKAGASPETLRGAVRVAMRGLS